MPLTRQLLNSNDRYKKESLEFRALRLAAPKLGWKVKDQSVYIMLTKDDPDYVGVVFRHVDAVQCYWLGYGHLQKQKRFSDFATPEECLEWIESQMPMELKEIRRTMWGGMTRYQERQFLIDDIFAEFYEGME